MQLFTRSLRVKTCFSQRVTAATSPPSASATPCRPCIPFPHLMHYTHMQTSLSTTSSCTALHCPCPAPMQPRGAVGRGACVDSIARGLVMRVDSCEAVHRPPALAHNTKHIRTQRAKKSRNTQAQIARHTLSCTPSSVWARLTWPWPQLLLPLFSWPTHCHTDPHASRARSSRQALCYASGIGWLVLLFGGIPLACM